MRPTLSTCGLKSSTLLLGITPRDYPFRSPVDGYDMGKCNPARCNRDVAGWLATYLRKRQKATAATHLADILDRRSQLGLVNCLACAG